MTPPDTHEKTEQQVNDLFDSLELTQAIDTEEFRAFLDHIPIPIIISKLVRGDQRIVYANKAYEALTGQTCPEIRGRGWSVLASFRLEDEPHLAFSDALATCDDFMGPQTHARRSLFWPDRERRCRKDVSHRRPHRCHRTGAGTA